MATETTFKLNEKVQWTSQSQGSSLTKRGEIVEVVPKGVQPQTPLINPGMHRNHESYVVQVGRKFYWPRVKQLSRYDETAPVLSVKFWMTCDMNGTTKLWMSNAKPYSLDGIWRPSYEWHDTLDTCQRLNENYGLQPGQIVQLVPENVG